jgi:N-acetylmuramoyl-L-alanine amidase
VKPEETVAAVSDIIPDVASKVTKYPVFGPGYENVIIENEQLNGAVFYLVSGHGGPDPGALGKYGRNTLSEDEYAYDVTLRLARNLISKGADVQIIIQDGNDGIRDESILPMDKDETTVNDESIPVNQKARLKQRTDLINKLYKKNKSPYQRLVAIHVDSRSTGQNIDVFFYHHHRSKSGRRLANSIHQTFTEKYARHQPGRQYHGSVSSRSSLYMIKNTLAPIVYIELGNIRNTRDQRRLVISDNRQALANWIAEGIVKDYGSVRK